jgi:hypothetical protein
MSGVAAASIIGGNPANGRRDADFYPTPHVCTDALIHAERDHLARFLSIWEPACGKGAICGRLSNNGFRVESYDLHNHDYGVWGVDFLDATKRRADAIVTNPPFSLATEFIRKADSLGVEYMALILKAHFWHAKRRTALFAEWSPARIYAMNWRPQFGDKGSPTMDFIWCVWDRHSVGPTTYQIMERPYD